ncbi:hypothetical protein pb186bvf_011319 [Paramecium bursaria]
MEKFKRAVHKAIQNKSSIQYNMQGQILMERENLFTINSEIELQPIYNSRRSSQQIYRQNDLIYIINIFLNNINNLAINDLYKFFEKQENVFTRFYFPSLQLNIFFEDQENMFIRFYFVRIKSFKQILFFIQQFSYQIQSLEFTCVLSNKTLLEINIIQASFRLFNQCKSNHPTRSADLNTILQIIINITLVSYLMIERKLIQQILDIFNQPQQLICPYQHGKFFNKKCKINSILIIITRQKLFKLIDYYMDSKRRYSRLLSTQTPDLNFLKIIDYLETLQNVLTKVQSSNNKNLKIQQLDNGDYTTTNQMNFMINIIILDALQGKIMAFKQAISNPKFDLAASNFINEFWCILLNFLYICFYQQSDQLLCNLVIKNLINIWQFFYEKNKNLSCKIQVEYRGQRIEDRGQRIEDRGQRIEDRGQRIEDRGFL